MIKEKMTSKNIVIAVLLLVVALLSFTVISKYATSAETHSSSIALLDEKKVTAMHVITKSLVDIRRCKAKEQLKSLAAKD